MKNARFFQIIKNFIFPPQCVFCDRVLEINSNLLTCSDCRHLLLDLSQTLCCEKCGKPITSYGEKQLCYFCLTTHPKYFDRIISSFEYSGIVRDAIVRYKALGIENYAKTFSHFLEKTFFENYQHTHFDLICSAPPHSLKTDFLRVDSTSLICKSLSKKTGIPFKKNTLIKVRKTAKQTTLGYSERLKNLQNSMQAKTPSILKGKIVLLADDVCTTRATIIECSRALKAAGAKKVYALTLATAPNKKA